MERGLSDRVPMGSFVKKGLNFSKAVYSAVNDVVNHPEQWKGSMPPAQQQGPIYYPPTQIPGLYTSPGHAPPLPPRPKPDATSHQQCPKLNGPQTGSAQPPVQIYPPPPSRHDFSEGSQTTGYVPAHTSPSWPTLPARHSTTSQAQHTAYTVPSPSNVPSRVSPPQSHFEVTTPISPLTAPASPAATNPNISIPDVSPMPAATPSYPNLQTVQQTPPPYHLPHLQPMVPSQAPYTAHCSSAPYFPVLPSSPTSVAQHIYHSDAAYPTQQLPFRNAGPYVPVAHAEAFVAELEGHGTSTHDTSTHDSPVELPAELPGDLPFQSSTNPDITQTIPIKPAPLVVNRKPVYMASQVPQATETFAATNSATPHDAPPSQYRPYHPPQQELQSPQRLHVSEPQPVAQYVPYSRDHPAMSTQTLGTHLSMPSVQGTPSQSPTHYVPFRSNQNGTTTLPSAPIKQPSAMIVELAVPGEEPTQIKHMSSLARKISRSNMNALHP